MSPSTATPPPSRRPRPSFSWRHLWRWVPYALLIVAALYLWVPRRSGPELGTPAPDFELTLVSAPGERFHLAEHRGQPVLVEVFASWCSACRRTAPVLGELARATRKAPVTVLAVSVDEEPELALEAAREWELGVAVAHAGPSFSRDYSVTTLPTFILIDADGKVVRSASGPLGRAELESWLTAVGAGRDE